MLYEPFSVHLPTGEQLVKACIKSTIVELNCTLWGEQIETLCSVYGFLIGDRKQLSGECPHTWALVLSAGGLEQALLRCIETGNAIRDHIFS